MQEKDFSKIEVKNNICINVFGYENELVFPIYISDQKFEERIAREDKKLINDLNYDGIEFPGREKDFSKIEKKNNI